jgi:hypothetical protein
VKANHTDVTLAYRGSHSSGVAACIPVVLFRVELTREGGTDRYIGLYME